MVVIKMANIYDPILNQFVYNVIAKAKGFYLRSLPKQWYDKLRTKRQMQSFADRSSLDQKFELLSLLGVEFFIFFHPQKFTEEELLTFISRDNETKNEFIKRMINSKCFVVSNKDIIHNLMLLSNDCHSETYLLNREYVMLSEAALNLHREKLDIVNDIKEVEHGQKNLLKLLFHFMNKPGQNYYYNEVVVTSTEMVYLLFSYINKHRFIDASYCSQFISSVDVINSAHKLQKKGLLYRKGKSFTINSDGVRFVGDILKSALAKTFEF